MKRSYYFRRLRDPGKTYRLLLVAHDRRVLKTDGTLSEVGAEFDDATFLHPMTPFPSPIENVYEAVVNVAEDTDPVTCSVFVLEVVKGVVQPPTEFENWHIDPTGERDVFGALKEPVQVVQTSITQNYAPPMQGR
jgi:hypothetical protein